MALTPADLSPEEQRAITALADAAHCELRMTPAFAAHRIFEIVERLAIDAYLSGRAATATQRRSSGDNNAGSLPRGQTSDLPGPCTRKHAAGEGND